MFVSGQSQQFRSKYMQYTKLYIQGVQGGFQEWNKALETEDKQP